jgi:transposase
MVDIATHRIVDLIDSRDSDKVEEWLKTFPALKVVSRDGSISYKSVISKVNDSIVQVSDRFHLLQGLTNAAKTYVNRKFRANIGLPIVSSRDGLEESGYWLKDTGRSDARSMKHKSTTEKKARQVMEVRRLHREGYAPGKIPELVGLSRSTVYRYLNTEINPENPAYNTVMPSKIKPYAQVIKHMLSKGQTFKQIESHIRQQGYNGSSSTIRMFATRERKLMKEAAGTASFGSVDRVERKRLVSLLYKPLEKVKGLSQVQLDKVITLHPVLGDIYSLISGFKEILFSTNEDALDAWLFEAEQLDIEEITSFVNGVRRDIDAVKNAILYDFNNGLAEGSVNKLKVTKRIMYGRCSFDLLRKKILRLESKRKIN